MSEADTQKFSYDNIKPLSRVRAKMVSLAFGNPLYGLTLTGKTPGGLDFIPPDPWIGKAERGRALLRGVQDFAGQVVESQTVQWEPFGVDEAWMTEMHSFSWLRDLRTVGGDAARSKARELISDWLDHYGSWHDTTWRPDILGRRIAAWISLYGFYGATAGDAFQTRVIKSLLTQARHLSRILPSGLTGLKLLDAVRGLAFSGLAIAGAEARVNQALDLLERDLPLHILPDGGPASRNPHDLALILRHLIDLRGALCAADFDLPPVLEHGIQKITPVLRFFRHGDGGLVLFNGAQESDGAFIDAILNRSGVRGRLMKTAPDSGYERMAHGRTLIVMDAGTPQSDNPYAHAGSLSFEMSVGRDRLIVNCGSYPTSGKWREILRSTAAHSTVVVGDYSSCGFRKDGKFDRKPVVTSKRKEIKGACLVQASHDGYMPTHGIVHRRCLYLGEGGRQVLGEDVLSGRNGVPFVIRFHLHPSVRTAVIRNGEEALLSLPNGQGWRMHVDGGLLALEDSIYLGQGSQPRRTQQIVINGETFAEETAIRWTLNKEG